MPFNYKSPGVYVEEVSGGARPIESAATSVLAMIGFCRDTIQVEEAGGNIVVRPTPTTPTLVTNWTEFTNHYGDMGQAYPGGYLHDAMFGYFQNGGTVAFVVGVPAPVSERIDGGAKPLVHGEGFLMNSAGQRILRLASGPLGPDEQISVEVAPAEPGAPEGTFNLVVRRNGGDAKVVPNLTLSRTRGQRNVVEVLARETDNLVVAEVLEPAAPPAERLPAVGTTTALVPTEAPAKPLPQLEPDLFYGNAAARTGIDGLEAIDEVTLVACPDIVAAHQRGLVSDETVKAVQTRILNHCEAMKDRFAILDCPLGLSVQAAMTWRKETMNFDSKYGALYYPWVKVDGKLMPPSGHLAGVYARVDGERGVHKAPANEIMRGVIGLERNVSRNEQDMLNPIAVNCIRAFPGQGIRIWGARTLSSDAEWRYINVRRLFCNIEESILQSTNWIVFEPNDDFLWQQIRRDINAYLTVQWRSGALFGQVPEQAFYVKCDEETNPKELRDLGYCVVEVGLAPVKPAEFVVFRISQLKDGAGATSE
jgi:phage tail sheath protein FI